MIIMKYIDPTGYTSVWVAEPRYTMEKLNQIYPGPCWTIVPISENSLKLLSKVYNLYYHEAESELKKWAKVYDE